ncbi:DUF2380 domain-containing protein [Bradyrhizobium jicamae]|nr:DUF2380 domain-containing protein [Bradyrhizobium jicamae]
MRSEISIFGAGSAGSGDGVRQLLAQSGRYRVIDASGEAAQPRCALRDCDGCDAAFAAKLGADQSLIGVVRRVSRTRLLTPRSNRFASDRTSRSALCRPTSRFLTPCRASPQRPHSLAGRRGRRCRNFRSLPIVHGHGDDGR